MSITDTFNALNTGWTEQSEVAFTTGSVYSVSACVIEVGYKLQRGTLGASTTPTSTQVEYWLKRAKMEMVEAKGFTFARRYAYANLVLDTYRYALPPDYNGGDISIRDITNDRYITVWSEDWYNKKFPDPSEETSGEVIVACVKNMELWVAPPSNGTATIELEYDRSGGDTVLEGTDMTWLPEMERFRCCDFATGEAFASLHMWDEARFYMNRWNSDMAKAIKADGKRKWQGKRYQAINVFQEYDAMNYQP